ncbi:MAG: cation:proton antiporter [Phycisphaerae bacterium]
MTSLMAQAAAHPFSIEHSVGIYIGILLVACLAGVLTKWIVHVPYTVALTLIGLGIALLPIAPSAAETGFSKELIFFVMLPPLLFNGAINLSLRRLLQNIWPILTFAAIGLLISMFVIAGLFWWGAALGREDYLIALLFGAMVTPTDPVSVLAIFKEHRVPAGLRYIVEGESLFNDGVGIVVFSIVLGMITGHSQFTAAGAVIEFLRVALGGFAIGIFVGAVVFLILRRLDDPLLENAICLVLAYGSFWLAEVFHLSGVIATVMAGLLIGNYGRRWSMRQKTVETVETFFNSIDFLINSMLFILIGLELRGVMLAEAPGSLSALIRPLIVAVVAMIVSRAAAVYPLYRVLNLAGTRRPARWAHVLFWGGLRGSIPIALLLGLPHHPAIDPHRPLLLVCGFSVVLFSLVVQGTTMKPLLNRLQLSDA